MAKTVLIVDDIPFVRKTLRDILTAAKFHVVGEAADGAEAIAQYERLTPDLVTMDVVMPQMSGIEATRRILKINKDARVIIISAMNQENLLMEAISVGARDCLLKPFTAEQVVRTLERASGESVARQGGGRETRLS